MQTYLPSTYFFFLLGRCVRADAAADLAAFEDFGLRKTLPAADAAFLDVTSLFFLAIFSSSFLNVAMNSHIFAFEYYKNEHELRKMWCSKKNEGTPC